MCPPFSSASRGLHRSLYWRSRRNSPLDVQPQSTPPGRKSEVGAQGAGRLWRSQRSGRTQRESHRSARAAAKKRGNKRKGTGRLLAPRPEQARPDAATGAGIGLTAGRLAAILINSKLADPVEGVGE